MGDLTIQLLAELIDLPYSPPTIRQLPASKRRAYHNDAVGKTRDKVGTALTEGVVLPTRDHIRSTLSDAALHILLSDGGGSDLIRQAFGTVFGDAAETALRKVCDGKIEPTFFTL